MKKFFDIIPFEVVLENSLLSERLADSIARNSSRPETIELIRQHHSLSQELEKGVKT